MKLRKRWVIPIVALALLLAVGLSWRWYVNRPEYRVRRLLARMQWRQRGLVERWLGKLGLMEGRLDGDDVVDGLVEIGPAGVPALLEAWKDCLPMITNMSGGLPTMPDVIESAFLRMGVSTRPPLIAELDDEDPAVRVAACYFLGLVGRFDGPLSSVAEEAILRALTDEDKCVRSAAAYALGLSSPSADKAVPALRAALDDEALAVRHEAAWALNQHGWEVAAAAETLGRDLKDERSAVWRIFSARELGHFDAETPGVVPALIEALKDEDERVRQAVAEALGEMGPAARTALPALKESLADVDDEMVRGAMAEGIKKIQAATQPAHTQPAGGGE